jgi:hypothetical protein
LDKTDLWDEHSLQTRFSDYLAESVFTSKAEKALVKHILANGDACIFGGVIRDFLLNRDVNAHRDIDLVIAHIDRPLEKFIQRHLIKKNRFGGYKLSISSKYYDIWTLNDTWAVRRYGKTRHSLRILPATSFFNVNAIIYSLKHGKFIMHKKFRQSIENRVLDIVYEPNPCPELCIVKAYQLIHELQMCASDRVLQYIGTWFNEVKGKLVDIQVSHFGDIRYSIDELERFASKTQETLSGAICSKEHMRPNTSDWYTANQQSISSLNRSS